MPRLILVVDDDPLTLQTINEMLLENSRGVFEVVNANNGILGLEIADKLRPDVIITDWEMPRMDGIEFIKKIKASEKTREIPVIMASGIMLTSKDLGIALDAGAVDYIRKPIDRVELQARVRSALEIADQIKRLRKKQELITAQKTAILQQNIDKLQSDLEFQHGELNSQLSYLMQKENDRQEIIQELNKLKPYLNQEGKLRLAQLSDRLNAQDHSHSVLELENRFDEVNHKFYQALEAAVPGITKTEKVLSAYTLMRLAPAEIVSVTGKNLNSVNVAFSRLRAKLKVASNSELKDVLQNLAGKGNP